MRLRSLAAALAVTVVAVPTLAAETSDVTLYLRSEGATCADKVDTLQLEAGEGETTCNTRVGLPLYEISQTTDAGLSDPVTYTAPAAALGFTLDAATDLAGMLTFRHGGTPTDQGLPSQPIPAGGGHYEVDVEIRVNGKFAGGATFVAQTGSMDVVEMPFTLDIDDAFNGVTLEKLSFSVGVGGVTPNSGWVKLDGASFLTVPQG